MNKTVKEFTEFYGLDKLIEEENARAMPPDAITLFTLTQKTGWSRSHATKVVTEWQEAGRVEYLGKRREPTRGQMVDAWRVKS